MENFRFMGQDSGELGCRIGIIGENDESVGERKQSGPRMITDQDGQSTKDNERNQGRMPFAPFRIPNFEPPLPIAHC
jgi:hypothetical protein